MLLRKLDESKAPKQEYLRPYDGVHEGGRPVAVGLVVKSQKEARPRHGLWDVPGKVHAETEPGTGTRRVADRIRHGLGDPPERHGGGDKSDGRSQERIFAHTATVRDEKKHDGRGKLVLYPARGNAAPPQILLCSTVSTGSRALPACATAEHRKKAAVIHVSGIVPILE